MSQHTHENMTAQGVFVNRHRPEVLPHIFGAHPLQYRQGAFIANAETPPCWFPEMANDPVYPYTLPEYIR